MSSSHSSSQQTILSLFEHCKMPFYIFNWSKQVPLEQWRGVKTADSGSAVIALELDASAFHDIDGATLLDGELNVAVWSKLDSLLPALRKLDLRRNRITNTALSLSHLPRNLVALYLDHCGLRGRLDLTNAALPATLEILWLNNNAFEGQLDLSRLDRAAPRLRQLHLSFNRFFGEVQLAQLPATLAELRLDHNELEGEADLDRLPAGLSQLDLSSNRFSSLSLLRLPRTLKFCDVSENLLEGSLDCTNLPSALELLDCRNNSNLLFMASLPASPLPAHLRLYFDKSVQLEKPQQPHRSRGLAAAEAEASISLAGQGRAIVDFFSSCKVPQWPASWNTATPLTEWKAENGFQIKLNQECTDVIWLMVDGSGKDERDKIHGGPLRWSNLEYLQKLRKLALNHNRIESRIETFLALSLPSSLLELNLANNAFVSDGVLDLGCLPPNLSKLDLRCNRLGGTVKLEKLSKSIRWIYLNNNQFSGTIDLFALAGTASPAAAEDQQQQLCWLDLRENQLSKCIVPETLPKDWMGEVVHLDSSVWQFTTRESWQHERSQSPSPGPPAAATSQSQSQSRGRSAGDEQQSSPPQSPRSPSPGELLNWTSFWRAGVVLVIAVVVLVPVTFHFLGVSIQLVRWSNHKSVEPAAKAPRETQGGYQPDGASRMVVDTTKQPQQIKFLELEMPSKESNKPSSSTPKPSSTSSSSRNSDTEADKFKWMDAAHLELGSKTKDILKKADVGRAALVRLDRDDLLELGVALGDRKVLLREIERLLD